uniref:Uncharacterized protein n=1 Tax=Tanacetum cinerariifolium TaxID=118510 RepID=A0A6L2P729_TANCI|nr:hypothetical protein [Tanacetum cinerariifolium]
MPRKKLNVLAQHLQEIMEESLPTMVDDRFKELTRTQVPLERENLQSKITSQINCDNPSNSGRDLFSNSKPGLYSMTSGLISSGLNLTYAPSTITTQQPSEGELDLLFEAMHDDYIGGQPSATVRTIPPTQEP